VGEWRYSSTLSLASAQDEGEWSASRPGRFTTRERAPVTHRIGGWVGPMDIRSAISGTGLKAWREGKILSSIELTSGYLQHVILGAILPQDKSSRCQN